ncbi:MAG: 50S ribosomal protein L9 [Patescibacteria group bacterium]|jgi:large subunit ribosomal protein L9
MEVIFTKKLEGIGELGERRNVKPGFARNYLIPKGLAFYATDSRAKKLESEYLINKEKEEDESRSKDLAESIQNLNLNFVLKAEKGKKAYTGINAKKIEDELAEKYQIHAEKVNLKGALKDEGDHSVKIVIGGKEFELMVKIELK